MTRPDRYCELAAAQIAGKTIDALRHDPVRRNWSMLFTDGTHITFGTIVIERYLPDGQDMLKADIVT